VSNVFDTFLALFYYLGVKGFLHPLEVEADEMENRIKEYREANSLSQGKLAELCNVSRQTINAIENNKYDPSLQLAFDIARTLGVAMEDLFISENGGKRNE
jgi:putative transcriptional regulator